MYLAGLRLRSYCHGWPYRFQCGLSHANKPHSVIKVMQSVDALVIGGGPAGTTAATLLARQGWQVALLEKDLHPRFHIGESLLPGNLAILDQLGVLERVRDIGVRKPGADFTGPDGKTLSFPFARALGDTPGYAFQVRRSEFDQLLFENCCAAGVDARQRHEVVDVRKVGVGKIRKCSDNVLRIEVGSAIQRHRCYGR